MALGPSNQVGSSVASMATRTKASGTHQACTGSILSRLCILLGAPAWVHLPAPVGCCTAGPVPRCQLALTLLLAEAAGGRLATPPQLFDPAFTEVRP